ncbi:FAD-dependent oxidoreductase [Actinoplanes rectilineatus]|uniref:FAD-dependent oxidoreductase n=1 Tax=Actinoplanes rectilineatus TaxID=113571 RepID=UPI0005F29907|nr:FAD-dependent oxidoreductase [Actinoplanes rectilineatus]
MSTVAVTDVLVVGAGPTGLTLACDLARRGVGVRVIERFDAPSITSRGKGLQPRSLEIFDDLGVADEILTRGAIRIPVRMITADGTVTDRGPITVPAPDPTATPYRETLWIAEFDVEGPLRDRLALDGVPVEFGTRAVGLEQGDDHVTVAVESPRGPETIRARWVVGADGGRSTIRRALQVPFEGFTVEELWYLGDVRLEGLDHGRQYILPTASGALGLTPLPTTDLWQWQSMITPGDDAPEEPSLQLYQRLLDEHLGAGRVVLTEATWLSLYRANVRLAARYRAGRVLLAGDAAHAHTPAGGQGMNTGVQDAFNLAWKLDAVLAGAGESLLDSYEQERRPVAAAVLASSTAKIRKFETNAVHGVDGVNKGFEGMGADTSGLSIAYPDSPLSLDGIRAERAPYATGLRGAGFAGSTFDLFRGPHWTVLLFSDDSADAELLTGLPADVHVHRIGSGAIQDAQGQAAERFRAAPGTIVLVRPDGYLAARIPATRSEWLRKHLGSLVS